MMILVVAIRNLLLDGAICGMHTVMLGQLLMIQLKPGEGKVTPPPIKLVGQTTLKVFLKSFNFFHVDKIMLDVVVKHFLKF